jgi:hypothetical protein
MLGTFGAFSAFAEFALYQVRGRLRMAVQPNNQAIASGKHIQQRKRI